METCKCGIKIKDLSVKRGNDVIIHNVSLDVHHGEMMALIGRNGAGKSTLLKALLNRLPYSGRVVFFDAKGNAIEKPHIGYVPQNLIYDPTTPVTVSDMLCANQGRLPVWWGHKKEYLQKARALLKKVGAPEELLSKKLGSLSGGELQRVLLAFALEPHPDLLLLDEPVSAVDRKGIDAFYKLVASMRSDYHMPIILVSHDLSYVQKYATSAALLDRTILLSGSVNEVLKSPQIQEIFGLNALGGK